MRTFLGITSFIASSLLLASFTNSAFAGATLQFVEYGSAQVQAVGQVKNFFLLRDGQSVKTLVIHSTDGISRCVQALPNLNDVNAKALIENLKTAESISCIGKKQANNPNVLETNYLELGYSK